MIWLICLGIVAFVIWRIYNYFKKITTIEVDSRGYLRNGFGRLVHRDVAYNQLYNYPAKHSLRFGDYDVHHKDRNKTNNHPSNLKILTRDEHKAEHGF